jgi:DNA-binding NarL/FixJ family response regulator
MLGAAAPHLPAGTTSFHPPDPADRAAALAAVRASLGGPGFAAAWAAGRAMPLEQASDDALVHPAPAASVEGAAGGRLTPREREVAALVAEGFSNREIAATLVIAERTAEGHVAHLLDRLGFRSRVDVAAWATEHGLRRSAALGGPGGGGGE